MNTRCLWIYFVQYTLNVFLNFKGLYPPVSFCTLLCSLVSSCILIKLIGYMLYPSVSWFILKVRMHAVSFCILVYLKGNGYMLYPPVSRFTLKVRIHAVSSCILVYLECTDTCCILFSVLYLWSIEEPGSCCFIKGGGENKISS